MLTCHVDPLSDGVLVGSLHRWWWVGGLQLPQGDTFKLVDSVVEISSPHHPLQLLHLQSRGGQVLGSNHLHFTLPGETAMNLDLGLVCL